MRRKFKSYSKLLINKWRKNKRMHAPQIIMIILLALGVWQSLMKHGEYRSDEKYNFWASLIAAGIEVALLYWGGFWG